MNETTSITSGIGSSSTYQHDYISVPWWCSKCGQNHYGNCPLDESVTTYSWWCPRCQIYHINCGCPYDAPSSWVNPWYSYYCQEDKMQKAYEILNKLIKEGIIPEPKDYKEFCRILEIIKGVA